jgi:SAM-dependent methyltransferase
MVIDAPMRAYYERRAAEYDDWWNGTGLFAHRHRPGWHAEVAQLIEKLRALPAKRTLDVACGTAFLTRELPGEVTGVDQSKKMVEIARSRGIDAVHGDAVPLRFDDGAFERVFTSHFYGHLREDERAPFLAEAARVASELVIVDSGGGMREEWQDRVLNDGTHHKVYKRWFDAAGLAAELGDAEVLHDGRWFVAVGKPLQV